jgi:PBP1b-binding outer membrane lipoprotein LpoB
MNSRLLQILVALLLVSAAAAPADAQRRRKSVYVEPGKVTDNSNKYSDTDLRLLTSKMIESMITSTFDAPAPGTAPSDRPVIAMGRLENRTTQDIDVKLILETIEVGILKSKAAMFVNRSEQFKVKMAEEAALTQTLGGESGPSRTLLGYQYLLEGAIVEIPSDDLKTRYYKLTLTLTDIRSSAKVWAEEQELKKRQ